MIAVDRETGEVKWERLAREEVPHQSRNRMGAWATASPITDGERVHAFFGSRGLYCYTFEGELIWEKDFGDMDTGRDMFSGASSVLSKKMNVMGPLAEAEISVKKETDSGLGAIVPDFVQCQCSVFGPIPIDDSQRSLRFQVFDCVEFVSHFKSLTLLVSVRSSHPSMSGFSLVFDRIDGMGESCPNGLEADG